MKRKKKQISIRNYIGWKKKVKLIFLLNCIDLRLKILREIKFKKTLETKVDDGRPFQPFMNKREFQKERMHNY